MGQTDSSPALFGDITDLQDKLHQFHDIVSNEVGSSGKADLKSSLVVLDEAINTLKQGIVDARELSDMESKLFNCVTTCRNVLAEILDAAKEMISKDQQMAGIVRISVLLRGEVGTGPPTELLVAFFKITLVFLQAFTAKQTADSGYIVHEPSTKRRSKDDDIQLAALRDGIKHFIDAELPRFGEPEKIPFPHQVDILAELAFFSERVKIRFDKANNDDRADRKDASKAVSTYCILGTLHLHALVTLLVKFRTVERGTDAASIIEKMELLKQKVKVDLAFWRRFWQDFQNDRTRTKFFNLLPEFNSKSPIAVESRKRRNSVMCSVTKGVMVVRDTPDKECDIYKSTYDFRRTQDRPSDVNMLACLYKLSKHRHGDDPTNLRLFCDALLGLKALSCKDLPLDDIEVFRTILKQNDTFKKTKKSCYVM